MEAIRWSGENDRYFGPFTYSRDRQAYRPFAIQLGSGDGDDYPGCRFRLSGFGHTLIVALPPVIKPYRKWHEITTEPTRSKMIKGGRDPGYWESYRREYGFTVTDGAVHYYYGEQTHSSDTDKTSIWSFPWREHQCIRHSLYDLDGDHFATLPEWGFAHKNGRDVRNAIEAVCPVAKFEFADFDDEKIVATCKIEEREWQRGKGIFRLLYLGRNKVRRSLDIEFSSEVGNRKGSWKGGTIGCGIDMLEGELHDSAFRRYCEENDLTFYGPVRETEDTER